MRKRSETLTPEQSHRQGPLPEVKPKEVIDLVSRGDIVIVNPAAGNVSNDPKEHYHYWDGYNHKGNSEFVYFIAQVDNDIIVEDATRRRKLIPAQNLRQIVSKSAEIINLHEDIGPY
jgi:hypothetical protein